MIAEATKSLEEDAQESTPEVEEDNLNQPPAEQPKRGPGRPPKNPNKVAITLPKPPGGFQVKRPASFVEYWKSLTKDQAMSVLIRVYRLWPVINNKQVNPQSNNDIDTIPGEDCFFGPPDEWEESLLHRYGSGWYQLYLNQDRSTVCRVVMKTRQDLANYPPRLISGSLVDGHPDNAGYVQYLKDRGLFKGDESEMQLADTVTKLTDTVIAQANRINTPIPQMQQPPSMAEKLTFEMASGAIDMFKEKTKSEIHASAQQTNGLDLVDKIVNVAEKMNPSKGNGMDETTKMMMTSMMEDRKEARERAQRAEERHEKLMERMFAQRDNPATQPKSLIEQMREMAEMRTLMSDAFGTGAAAEEAKETIPEMLIKNAPTLLQTGLGMFTQFNQSLGLMARMKELEVMRASGQAPTVVTPPPTQPAQPSQPQVTAQQPTAQRPMNPSTNQPYTDEELETIRQERAQYAAYHGFIAEIAEPLINHLNGRHPESNEPLNGYDFAGWFITGKGRLAYDTVKSVGPETLLNALKTYPPVWNVIGGVEPRVKQFLGEFLTLDEMLQEDDGDEGEDDKK